MNNIYKKIGIKNYLLWKLLCIIEFTINIPYFIIQIPMNILCAIFNLLDNIFSKERLFYLAKIRLIREYYKYLWHKMREIE